MPLGQAMALMEHVTELEYRRQYSGLVSAFSVGRVAGGKAKLPDFFPPWASPKGVSSQADESIVWLLSNKLLSQDLMQLIGLERIRALLQ